FFSSRRRHTRWPRDWSSDVCSSDLWAFLAPAIFWLTHRVSFTRHPWRSAAIHLPATFVFLFARMQLRLLVGQFIPAVRMGPAGRSEERRVGKECRSRWSRNRERKQR